MVTLQEIWHCLNGVSSQDISVYRHPKEQIDITHKEKYEVVSITPKYNKYGMTVKVKPI